MDTGEVQGHESEKKVNCCRENAHHFKNITNVTNETCVQCSDFSFFRHTPDKRLEILFLNVTLHNRCHYSKCNKAEIP